MEYDGDISNKELVKRTKSLINRGIIVSPNVNDMHRVVDGNTIWCYHKDDAGTKKYHKKLKDIKDKHRNFIFDILFHGESLSKKDWIFQNNVRCKDCAFLKGVGNGNFKCTNPDNIKNPLFSQIRLKNDIACTNFRKNK